MIYLLHRGCPSFYKRQSIPHYCLFYEFSWFFNLSATEWTDNWHIFVKTSTALTFDILKFQ